MTLKSLFSKEFFTRLKHRFSQFNWLTSLWLVALAFIFPIFTALAGSSGNEKITERDILGIVTGQTYILLVLTVGMAFATVGAFSYLFSRKELDFYHSQPVTRKELFARNYLVGWICFLIPLLIALVAEVLVITAVGIMSVNVFIAVIKGLLSAIGLYFSVNAIATLAAVVCGTKLIALLTAVYFCAAPAMISGMVIYFINSFSQTFMYDDITEKLLSAVSPIIFFIDYGNMDVYSPSLFNEYSLFALGWVVISALLVLLAGKLYLNRKSEYAGKSLAVKGAIWFIKYPLTLFCAWVGGMAFRAMTDGIVAGIVGFALIATLTYSIVGALEEMEFKAAFKNYKPLLATVGIYAGCLAVIFAGCVMFDTRTTSTARINSVDLVNIRYNEFFTEADIYNGGGAGGSLWTDGMGSYMFTSGESKYSYSTSKLYGIDDPDAIQYLNTIVKIGIEENSSGKNLLGTLLSGQKIRSDTEAYTTMHIRFNTQFGSYTREYSFACKRDGEVFRALRGFMDSSGAYKSYTEGVFASIDKSLNKFSFRSSDEIGNKEKMEAIYNALQKDIQQAEVQDYAEKPLGFLRICYSARKSIYSDESTLYTVNVPVFPSFENTLALAENKLTEYLIPFAVGSENVFNIKEQFTYETGYSEGYAAGYKKGTESYGFDYIPYTQNEITPNGEGEEYGDGYFHGFLQGYNDGYINAGGDPYAEGYKAGSLKGESDFKEGLDPTDYYDYNYGDYAAGFEAGYYDTFQALKEEAA